MLSPIRIDNRINGFLGKPSGIGKRPAVIHLHERYGIVEHTTDLGEKFVHGLRPSSWRVFTEI
jgi:dienelactone hydrolase